MFYVLHMVAASLANLPMFILYLFVAFIGALAFMVIYLWATPQDEIGLIRAGNTAAAISFGGALGGFAIPFGAAIAFSHNLIDMIIWATIALIIQVMVFKGACWLIRGEVEKIEHGEMAPAVFLAAVSVAAGVINAACMTP
jgi:putative membrane protein